jgi:protein gp37
MPNHGAKINYMFKKNTQDESTAQSYDPTWINEKQSSQQNEANKVEQSKIQWTGPTWNPWHGCTKVSDGCRFCYMYRDKEKYGQDAKLVVKSKTKFKEPLKWKTPQLVFTCSWSDWFIEEADEWRHEAWEIIKNTPQHTYQILTKRPERIMQCLPADWGEGYPNVWLGTSVESNKVKERVEILSRVPAQMRFISAEPLIGELNLDEYADIMSEKFHWVIIGGESGNDKGHYRYRECKLEWIEGLITACREYGVSVFVKQLGTHLSKELVCKDRHAGKIAEWPVHLQVREFPIDITNFNINS